MDTQEWTLLDPAADAAIESFAAADPLEDFAGKRIGLWWNGKPNGDVFLDEVAAQLQSRFPGMEIVRMWERDPATKTFYGVAPDRLRLMAQSADVVIGASGD